jgi:hypothetical protein
LGIEGGAADAAAGTRDGAAAVIAGGCVAPELGADMRLTGGVIIALVGVIAGRGGGATLAAFELGPADVVETGGSPAVREFPVADCREALLLPFAGAVAGAVEVAIIELRVGGCNGETVRPGGA